MTLICKQCGVEVASRAALVGHWKEQREQGKEHYHCTQCMMKPFQADIFKFHAAKQDLECPGCNERFLSVSSLMGHIEKSRCTRIGKDDYVTRREEKLAFTRELQRREFENPTRPVAGGPGVAGVPAVRKAPFSDFPRRRAGFLNWVTRLSRSVHQRAWVVKGEETAPQAAEARKKNLFPKMPPAQVRPGSRENKMPSSPSRQRKWKMVGNMILANPDWDARKYYVTYLNKFKCPHDRCPKSFPRVAGLRGHLSSSHIGQHKVQCPRCFKWFNSMTAITAHAESQSARCDLRWTNGYRELIDQMTAGIVDTAGKHEDGTVKYTVPDTARQYFGTSQGKWAAEQRNQQDGWGSNKAEGGSDEQAPKQD
ncbi:hypothetical protein CHGG_02579 [Chaetomium globosum CBS 148.51]|uniref:C2H2-type domain-containing protein n=1 Tax=Chaetomium globosum (strain ATCC 6205 / CBS 148.51 / DSM 1962 / NBRC 6347 / NRRL 1970) TaxID=306901 RepID=Q2HB25_CHAGB|nr:uncharacterized protein CHGG_02579 [Chaetomium globosum CBS 148.51]EAQ90644.1 hypothetical protein CHGG_02579 [Chaetomium globosum CBS 148.51]